MTTKRCNYCDGTGLVPIDPVLGKNPASARKTCPKCLGEGAVMMTAAGDVVPGTKTGTQSHLDAGVNFAMALCRVLDDHQLPDDEALVSALSIVANRLAREYSPMLARLVLEALRDGLDPAPLLSLNAKLKPGDDKADRLDRAWRDHLGRAPWVVDLDLNQANEWATRSGMPGILMIGNTIQGYCLCHGRTLTAHDVARGLNLPLGVVINAIDEHPWLFLDDGTVQHEGE